MSQNTLEASSESNGGAQMNVDNSLSETSIKQREGPGNVGAFGKRTGHSDLVFFEGFLPTVDEEVLNDRSIDEQVDVALDNLETALDGRRGMTLADVMKVEVQLTDPDTAEAIDHVYESRFDGADLPPRTVVGVCSLPGGADVQIDVIAADE